MPEPAQPVLAIIASDRLLHIGPPDRVIEHVDAEAAAAPAGTPVPVWEYYDGQGRHLRRVPDAGGGPDTLEVDPAAAVPADRDRQLIADRIDSFLAAAQVRLTRDLLTGIIPKHIRVPRLVGDLPDVLTALSAVMTVPEQVGQPDVRDWLHNIGHRLFG